MESNKLQSTTQTSAPARVAFLEGQGELPILEITTPWSTAEVFLHGAQVTRFVRKGEPPVLFMSQCSRFEDGKPIRGGVPVILPWFGFREGMGQHGFARTRAWELKEVSFDNSGSVHARFRLPQCPEAAAFPPFRVEYSVCVSDTLEMRLDVMNLSSEELDFEDCLHTYFEVSDATAISILGLKGHDYLDQVANFASKRENEDAIRISSEVDRMYLNATGKVEIIDPRYGRKIIIEKSGSSSTVVWNPWIEKAQRMPDFGNEEYERMVCVESGNVGPNSLHLAPGESNTLAVRLRTAPLA
jgi:D-hexose-6-phosphate mutarotase